MGSDKFLLLIVAFLVMEILNIGMLDRWLNMFSPNKAQVAEANDSKKASPQEVSAGLRELALSTKAIDFSEKAGKHGVYGVLMETGYPEGTVTLVAFMSGDASLYFSGGGGMIGGIGHETVRKAAIAFNKKADDFVASAKKTTSFPMPEAGQTIFYILTQEGIYAAEALENDLGNNISPFSSLFFAGQDVITEYRLFDEKKQRK